MLDAVKTGWVGVIADTHGLLRPEAVEALQGSSLIIHAGDIGKPAVLAGLQAIAPVIAIRGNIDQGSWAEAIPYSETVRVEGVWIYVLHALQDLDFDPGAAGFGLVISRMGSQGRDNAIYRSSRNSS